MLERIHEHIVNELGDDPHLTAECAKDAMGKNASPFLRALRSSW
jgi:hypothetical protein